MLESLPERAPDSSSSNGGSSSTKLQGIAARGLVSSTQPMYGGISITGSEELTVAFTGKGQSMGVPIPLFPDISLLDPTGKSVKSNWGTITNIKLITIITPPLAEESQIESLSKSFICIKIKIKLNLLDRRTIHWNLLH